MHQLSVSGNLSFLLLEAPVFRSLSESPRLCGLRLCFIVNIGVFSQSGWQ